MESIVQSRDHSGDGRVDCLIVGGGLGGLTTAIYAARLRLSVRVVDAGASRAALIPCTCAILLGLAEGRGPAVRVRHRHFASPDRPLKIEPANPRRGEFAMGSPIEIVNAFISSWSQS